MYFSENTYTSWHGRVLAVVRRAAEKGRLKITAKADGMEPVYAEIECI